ncbi:MAG: isoleucine--tRNA ligase [Anaerolineae bacterium]
MGFESVLAQPDFPAQERETIKFWRDHDIFRKTKELHKGQPKWSFVDGPITANNPMGVHHGWGRTYKDLYNRYWTMRGRELRYQQGFDCQGLWVEVEVEKELGFTSKKDIEDYGLAPFVLKCKERVLRYAAVQTEQSIRLGYEMDWNDPEHLRYLADRLVEDPTAEITVEGPRGPVTDTVENIVGRLGLPELGGSYFTFSNENNYMIWTFLKKCWQKGWLYRGADSMPWCPRCATGISQHEIVTDGYQEITHRSVTLRFPLRAKSNGQPAQPGESLLIWTTTPWTLTSNVAAAVGPDLDYVKVRQTAPGSDRSEILYLSKGTTHMLQGEFEVLAELKGKDMVGWTYDGPFDDLPAAQEPGGNTTMRDLVAGVTQSAQEAHVVIEWDEVAETEGTGIVHIAPGCGAEDFALGQEHRFPVLTPIDEEGYVVDGFAWLSGQFVGEVADPIFDDLARKDLLYQVEPYTHRYPTCWRCKTELVFRVVDEWFISMGELYDKPRSEVTPEEKARSLRYQIMDVTDQIRWIPSFGRERELDWLRNMHDWMISKKRYWGLALPIWECRSCDHFEVIGDEQELEARAVEGWQVFAGHTPHRPYVDAVKIRCSACGELMDRVLDVGNPWLDAGIVSFSTLSYRTDPDYWRQWYPADWISESFPGQFRNWFYSLLAMATVIDNSPPFLTNFSYATLLAEDGRAMHKSWGNSIEFNEAADKMGVDVMRWLYCAHKPENNLRFGYTRADEVRRRLLIPLWNVYNFLVTYAKLDGWTPNADLLLGLGLKDGAAARQLPASLSPASLSLLDRWILARLMQVIQKVTTALENYDAFQATLVVEGFIDDLTNWYVRRSRRRFWKSEHDADKDTAYATLYYVLVALSKLLAPLTPFVTEVMYQNLVRNVDGETRESVHHCDWPEVDSDLAGNEALIDEMALARQVSSLGLSARSDAGIKVRQPLARVLVHLGREGAGLSAELADIVMDELNVKELEFVAEEGQLVNYRVLPNLKVLGPRLGKLVPAARKALEEADAAQIVASVSAGQTVTLDLEGRPLELAPDEVLVQTQPAEGLAVAADRVVTVAVDTAITPELAAEGLAREIVRRVQNMRKEAGFNIEDRITIYYQAEGTVHHVMEDWGSYIKAETLATAIEHRLIPEKAFQKKEELDGGTVMLGVARSG